MRLSVLGMMTTETRLFALNKVTALDRVVTMIEVLGDYVRLQVFPTPLVGDYAYNFNPALLKHRTLDLPVLAAGLALGAAVLGMGVGWWRRHPTAPALAWFLIALTPYSNLVLQFAQVKTERLLYWPSAGSCMALAWLLARLDAPAAAGRASSRLARCLTPAVLGVFLVLTAVRNRDWRDGLTFFADVVEKQPLNPMGHAGLGAELIAAGRAEEGVGSALEALRLRPDFVHGRIVLAQGLEALGRPGEAADALAPAVTLDLTPRAVVYLTTLLGAAGRVDEAQAAGAEALTRFPGNPDATLALALIELGSGAAESARARLDPVIARYPGHAPARYHRGLALRMLGRTEEAIGDFDAALALDPALAPARLERSRLRVVMGVEVAAAVAELRTLVAGRPPFLAEAYAALVAGLRRLGDDAGARRVEAEAADAARMSASGAGS
ncbi:MAG: tetratricopeptide repeat protein [Planctomycetes bacterium]|nr:tetratricopeptide repeat protein [Planctomycetota bacterium]